mmetsp:Transcript_31268/g.71392  ORF Transcript_31268/g.71392 Transcript_31268/m.71392 type:complete len:248 (-) Transcript_31268:48-791(-)
MALQRPCKDTADDRTEILSVLSSEKVETDFVPRSVKPPPDDVPMMVVVDADEEVAKSVLPPFALQKITAMPPSDGFWGFGAAGCCSSQDSSDAMSPFPGGAPHAVQVRRAPAPAPAVAHRITPSSASGLVHSPALPSRRIAVTPVAPGGGPSLISSAAVHSVHPAPVVHRAVGPTLRAPQGAELASRPARPMATIATRRPVAPQVVKLPYTGASTTVPVGSGAVAGRVGTVVRQATPAAVSMQRVAC